MELQLKTTENKMTLETQLRKIRKELGALLEENKDIDNQKWFRHYAKAWKLMEKGEEELYD